MSTGHKCDINNIMHNNKNYYMSKQHMTTMIQLYITRTNHLPHKQNEHISIRLSS